MQGSTTSFCRKELMSVCTACSEAEQRHCCFYEKSRGSDRCMYFVFGEFCDCLNAQLHAS
jgi:hypothetical protein